MRICYNCNSDATYIDKKGYSHWYKHNGDYLCEKCHARLITNPKWNPIHDKIYGPSRNKKYNPRQMMFNGKMILLKENPRKGICEWCNRKGLTHMHHTRYDDNDPLKHTVELCPSCHAKESHRLANLNT